ncbi:hypothetical protein GGI12_005135 [Dipsacomyces acuminosporus]|nr:hypothetical protein GGI12_005135 [Dipsacomyces acuminosporus]
MDVVGSRLEALERTVYSASSSAEAANLAEEVAQIERQLAKTLAGNSSLAAGLQKCTNKLRDLIDGDGDLELHRRLLGVDAKTELILLNSDASQTLSDLRTIDGLQNKINQPEYKSAAEQVPRLQSIEAQHGSQASEFKNVVSDVSSLIDRYHSETEAVSEMFVEWDRVLASMERKVSELEAARAA